MRIMSQRGKMSTSAQVGSVALIVLLIGATHVCEALKIQDLAKSRLQGGSTSRANVGKVSLVDTTALQSTTTGETDGTTTTSNSAAEKERSNYILKEPQSKTKKVEVNESGKKSQGVVKLSATADAVAATESPAPGPSSAFSLLPSLATPALAILMSFAALAAAKAL